MKTKLSEVRKESRRCKMKYGQIFRRKELYFEELKMEGFDCPTTDEISSFENGLWTEVFGRNDAIRILDKFIQDSKSSKAQNFDNQIFIDYSQLEKNFENLNENNGSKQKRKNKKKMEEESKSKGEKTDGEEGNIDTDLA